jgi:hypothetical protein
VTLIFDEVRRSGTVGIMVAALLLATSCGEQRATAPETSASRSQNGAPSLVECPTSETTTTSGLVGLLGGSVELGATSISIPSGAITAPTLFQVTVPSSRFMEIDVSAVGFQSFLFEQQVTITIDYSRCTRSDIDQQTLHVWHIDPVTKELLEDMGGTDDKVARRITFTTGHLSGYAVAN